MPLSPTTATVAIDALFVILEGRVIEESAVLQSQVGDQMLALQRAGVRTGLITTTRDPTRFHGLLGDKLRAVGATIVLIPHRGRTRNIVAMTRVVRSLTSRTDVRTAYVRGIWGALIVRLAHPARKLRFVYDIRGTIADETIMAAGPVARVKASLYGALERWSIRGAWRVTTVSRPFADELRRSCGRGDAIVIPSCVNVAELAAFDGDARSVRENLGFSPDDLVLVYSGGADRYQAIPRLLTLWQALATADHVRLLMLTHSSQSHADETLAAFPGIANGIVRRSVPRRGVGRYLAACDAGFVLREPRLMNRVASPVKFAEYAAAGLAIVASPNIGDMSSLIVDRRIGIIVDTEHPSSVIAVREYLAELRRDRVGIQTRARALATERYSWDAYTGAHRQLYDIPGTQSHR